MGACTLDVAAAAAPCAPLMFTNPSYRIAPEARESLVKTPEKLVRMVDCVSTYLADILQITDHKAAGSMALVEVSRREIHHLLAVVRITGAMDRLGRTYEFVVQAEDLAERMRDCALRAQGENIDISVFTNEKPYYCDDQVTKTIGATTTTVDVGGLGYRIMQDVAQSALSWLDELDKVMSAAAAIERRERVTGELMAVKQKLATAIAKRVSMMSLDSVLDDELSARAMEGIIAEEHRRCEAHSKHVLKGDVRGLQVLRLLATDPKSEKVRQILANSLRMVSYVVESPPCELAPYRASMKFEQLARAFAPDIDIEIRVTLVAFWSDNYGEGVVQAIDSALGVINAWDPAFTNVFSNVFSSVQCNGRALPSLLIPTMRFLHAPKSFARREVRSRRTGLDEQGERAVRMVRFVWEMVSRGIIRSGVVSSSIVAAVATDGVLIGRMAAGMVNSERKVNQPGTMLSIFIARLQNAEGDHADTVGKAACALSMFSCEELEGAFRSDSDILRAVCSDLTRITRKRMMIAVPEDYLSFATEALAYTLPMVQQRRGRLGICKFMRSNALLDLMRTVPCVEKWTPQQGKLRLYLEDLQRGHERLRVALDALHEGGVLVTRARPRRSGARMTCYEFDTALLCRVFQYAACC